MDDALRGAVDVENLLEKIDVLLVVAVGDEDELDVAVGGCPVANVALERVWEHVILINQENRLR